MHPERTTRAHDGQKELLKKTGIAPSFSRPMYMPVETGFPVFGQLIMSSPIALSASLRPESIRAR
jgi:hypothetical protein